ncbi:MAG: phosphoribosylanthranilate isomerase [Thermoanaerobaculia bacterium]
MTRIKICGLTRQEDVEFSAEKGAEFLGFIFVPASPRFVAPEHVARITAEIRERETRPRLVGVFRDASPDYIREIASVAGLDMVQLHGTETDDDIRSIAMPVIKAFRVGDTLPDTTSHPGAEFFLFDTYEDRRAGGTGKRFDWSLLKDYSRTKPFLLAGGITADNVADAVSQARPDGVDVASGVESAPGIKDHTKIEALIERVRDL